MRGMLCAFEMEVDTYTWSGLHDHRGAKVYIDTPTLSVEPVNLGYFGLAGSSITYSEDSDKLDGYNYDAFVSTVGINSTATSTQFTLNDSSGAFAGNVSIDGGVVIQTDKFIICNVFTSTGINACIDALGAEGGEVYLPEGTYICSTAIVMDYSSTTVTGAGTSTKLDASAFQPLPAVIDTNDKDYITIQDLTIIGNAGGGVASNLIGDADNADFLRIENCWLYDSDNAAIRTNGYAVKIINCYVKNPDGRGIELDNFGYIEDCRIIDAAVNAIDLSINSDNSFVEGNYIENCAAKAIDINVGCNNVKIIDNEVRTSRFGFLIRGAYSQCRGNIIYDIQTGEYGIQANNADYSIFSNNIIYGTGDSDIGIHLDESDECIVTNNFTDNHDVAGIQEDSDCQKNLIYGNNCQDSTPYILLGTSHKEFLISDSIGLNSENDKITISTNVSIVGYLLVGNTVYAEGFVVQTKALPEKSVIADIMKMKNKEDGKIDYDSFGDCMASHYQIIKSAVITPEVRDSSGTIITPAIEITPAVWEDKKGIDIQAVQNKLIKVIQEQQAIIDDLKNRIAILEVSSE